LVVEGGGKGGELLLKNLDCVGVLARCTPRQKRLFVRELRRTGEGGVMMVGDGCNDVEAMEEADVGVGIMGGFGGAGEDEEHEEEEGGLMEILKRMKKTRGEMVKMGVDPSEAGQKALVEEMKRRSAMAKGGVEAAKALVGGEEIKETGGSLNADLTSLVPSISTVGSMFSLSLAYTSNMRQTVLQEVTDGFLQSLDLTTLGMCGVRYGKFQWTMGSMLIGWLYDEVKDSRGKARKGKGGRLMRRPRGDVGLRGWASVVGQCAVHSITLFMGCKQGMSEDALERLRGGLIAPKETNPFKSSILARTGEAKRRQRAKAASEGRERSELPNVR